MAIPSEMLYIKGMHSKHRYAGTASVKSLKSMPAADVIIKKPTKIRAGAVANPGIAQKIGDRKMETKNKRPVTTEASPVLAPAATPEELSTKVVVVEVPNTAPALVAIASAKRACLIRGSLPFLSSISALVATPIKVPRVSHIHEEKSKQHNNKVKHTHACKISFCHLTEG